MLATYRAREDLIAIGAYQTGSDARTDYAIEHVHALDAFLRQPPHLPEQAEIAESRLAAMLADSADAFGEHRMSDPQLKPSYHFQSIPVLRQGWPLLVRGAAFFVRSKRRPPHEEIHLPTRCRQAPARVQRAPGAGRARPAHRGARGDRAGRSHARTRTLEAANARLRARVRHRSVAGAGRPRAQRRAAARRHAETASEHERTLVLGARVDLAEARIRLETLEHLEERRRREHREAALREEEALLQDVVQARAARRAQLGGRRR